MNESERSELDRLKQRQALLGQELAALTKQLERLEHRLDKPAPTPLVSPPVSLPSTRTFPPPIPPIISSPAQAPEVDATPSAALPPPVPPIFPDAFSEGSGAADPAPGHRVATKQSFEMRLGTFWLVRVGIVMLVTGLVFFADYAYENFIVNFGPWGKVLLLYLVSGLLLGTGWWWQRRAAKPSLKNYAEVLFAGGLAAVYFTTYGAYHVEPIKIIFNVTLDGSLLLAWAAFMAWIADRKKSEVLAFFAVALAYYTSVITRVGYFTLYSNLVLTSAAVFFLVRNRWAALSFASLVATYASYGYWRFFDGAEWGWAPPGSDLWRGAYFLISYWVLFTSAVFLSRDKKFNGQNRAGFLTLNNGAFFAMFLLTMLQVRHGGFWKFCLIYGGMLLVLAEVARLRLSTEPLAAQSYLTQGLLLATVGLISNPRLAGLHLALVLAMESVILLFTGHQRKSLILVVAAYITAGLAVGWGMDGMREAEPHGLWLAVGLALLMFVNALEAHRRALGATRESLRPQPAYFVALALAISFVATHNNTTPANLPLVLAVEGLLFTMSIYVLRVREITLLSQIFVGLAQLSWLWHFAGARASLMPWWNPTLLIAITLALSHWWQKQKVLKVSTQFPLFCQGFFALATIGTVYFWTSPQFEPGNWLAVSACLGLGVTAYAVWTRAWLLALAAQLLLFAAGAHFIDQLSTAGPPWYLPLVPVLAITVLWVGTVRWFQRHPNAPDQVRGPLLVLALVYRWVTLAMSIWWVCKYIPERERVWVFLLLGLVVFLGAGWQKARETLLFGAAFSVTGVALFWLSPYAEPTVYLPNLLAILVLLAQQRVAKKLPARYALNAEIHGALMTVGGLSLWLYLSRWVLLNASGFFLTASWAAFALVLFICGIALRERVYRWLGLTVLTCAMGRVAIFDVWKLQAGVYRILSFMAMGIVLLVLGFVYNKYQDKIKEWL